MGYYFISIGGSGARVLESLTHLCVAGLLPNKEKQGHLYTMAIDPDTGNGNLNKTKKLLNYVNNFHFPHIDVGEGTPLLKTPLKLADPFCWSPAPNGENLDAVIGFANFKKLPVGKLYSSLYTRNERITPLDLGFRGRPSIGAAVMAKKALVDDYTSVQKETAWLNLVKKVNSDVGENGSAQIFLAGSIFGGTGASGLPTIAGLLRKLFKDNCKNGTVRIGGALLLPYFSFEPTPGEKQLFAYSDHFLTNTKAALRYYANTGGSGYDSIYFIGDSSMTPTKNFSVGASTQCNDAHIVDFFAAMAALHFYHEKNFADNGDNKLYYIAHQDIDKIQWNDLPAIKMDNGTTMSVKKIFVQFTRFIFVYLHMVKPTLARARQGDLSKNDCAWYWNHFNDVDLNSNFMSNFEDYAKMFVRWLNQVESPVGGRSVELINRDFFHVEDRDITINDTQLFSSLDYGISNVTIDSVMSSLAGSNKGLIGMIGRSLSLFGNKKNNQNLGKGFGRFLRLLYDGCAVS